MGNPSYLAIGLSQHPSQYHGDDDDPGADGDGAPVFLLLSLVFNLQNNCDDYNDYADDYDDYDDDYEEAEQFQQHCTGYISLLKHLHYVLFGD